MDVQLWSKVDDKSAVILALRGDEIHCLEVTGNKARQEAARIMGALQQGQEPSAVGANSATSLKVASIARAQVCEDNTNVEFHPQGESGETPQVHQRRQKGRRHHPGGPRPRRPAVPRGEAGHHGRRGRRAADHHRAHHRIRLDDGVLDGRRAGVGQGDRDHRPAAAGSSRCSSGPPRCSAMNGTLVLGGVLLLAIIGWATMRRRPPPAADRLAARAGVIRRHAAA